MSSSNLAVTAEGLRKRYGDKYALDGFDLTVPKGTVCGLLGPNGAGKTTAVRILATLLRFDEGRAVVAGHDVGREPAEVRHRIGLVGQNAAVDEVLSGYQNLVMFGRLYHLGAREAKARATAMLQQFRLTDTGSKPVKAYSGGMRRRLDLAASMILAPTVLFLDEPTVGLDPRSRNEVWQSVRDLVGAGTTVLLTTQYLDEADQLASQINVIDTGRVIAEGSPSQLKSLIGGDRIEFVVHDTAQLDAAARATARMGTTEPVVDTDRRQVSVQVSDKATALPEAVRLLDEAGIAIDDLALRRPTLDEVFLHLTGQHAERDEDSGQAKTGQEVSA
ncbi:ATP-binding cassette domain-containing protein [Streptomyces sp. ST2-7A]|uniref:ATP-binding cassette domain-containing protein n=1 Tax=Streptomyces sp. ST2-7A TaxID=2907214 RepID=UPI001F37E0E1|nr:ATP-binding cassette domain-containing protein [Streptomyces sp. ST2-7A]MCE7081121.1 ATP-binding cassette domain-containing protein [Streptomyces sp. ST2-7A]